MNMDSDPYSYYSILGVTPQATQEQIKSAYREKAKYLHPDLSRADTASAFLFLKKAHDVLISPSARATYDKISQAGKPPMAPKQPISKIKVFFSGHSLVYSAILGFIACIALLSMHQGETNQQSRVEPSRSLQNAASTRQPPNGAQHPSLPGLPIASAVAMGDPVRSQDSSKPALAGSPSTTPSSGGATHYVKPSGSSTYTWTKDGKEGYLIGESLPPFTSVELIDYLTSSSFAQIRLSFGQIVYVDSQHLTPGDAVAAEKAFCLYAPDQPIVNNEFLTRHGLGPHNITISNTGSRPSVAVMRSSGGVIAVSVFVAPYSSAYIDRFPSGNYRLEFATGQVFSRKCRKFVGERRAQRFPNYTDFVSTTSMVGDQTCHHYKEATFTITPGPNGNVYPIDMNEDEFSIE